MSLAPRRTSMAVVREPEQRIFTRRRGGAEMYREPQAQSSHHRPSTLGRWRTKRCIADGSVGFPHVRVGHRQDSIPKPLSAHAGRGFVFPGSGDRLKSPASCLPRATLDAYRANQSAPARGAIIRDDLQSFCGWVTCPIARLRAPQEPRPRMAWSVPACLL